jgi:murein tripeptide amidase MpaA
MASTFTLVLLSAFLLTAPLAAEAGFPSGSSEPIFPPVPDWKGKSLSVVVSPDDPWITPAETSGFRITPTYDETVAWMKRLESAAPQIRLTSIGRSPEGRDIWMAVVSKEGADSPRELAETKRPLILVQGGIHSGEIDGKDAGLMLLRDLTVGARLGRLLDKANLLFVPIFNVDGHERSSRFSRINQRGPEEMGWRTNARNLNLNRDYMKADTPEMQAMLRAIDRWRPDLYIDVHVTDGIDYQYDITWGGLPNSVHSPAGERWIVERFTPFVEKALRARGHIPGPLMFATNNEDYAGGLTLFSSNPRFSNGYGDARHLPTVLVENHSLKPYRQRVLGTYVLLAATLEFAGADREALRKAAAADAARRPEQVPINWKASAERQSIRIAAVESRRVPSEITGDTIVQWTGRPVTLEVPLTIYEPESRVRRPQAYWVPPAWPEVIERLALHGVRFERIEEAHTVEVEMYRLQDPKLEAEGFEGRPRVTARLMIELRTERFPPGSVRIPTDQPLGTLATLLLEPSSADSFFQWGFFLETLQRTEYVEAYIMAPMAERMLRENAALAAEFKAKLAFDEQFRASPSARLEWFYQRSPFRDDRWQLYPVGREIEGPSAVAPAMDGT